LKKTELLAVTVCLIGVTSFSAQANKKQLSPKPAEMVEALMALQRKPNDPATQERYLKIFPHDYASFMNLFSIHHPLYDGHEYILALTPLSKTHPMEVGRLLVGLSKDAHYEADALSALQDVMTDYAAQHTRMFAQLLKGLSPQKQTQLITFLADLETISVDPEYENIIKHLEGLGDADLARKFVEARVKREKEPHD
jgi:hypothetical protein